MTHFDSSSSGSAVAQSNREVMRDCLGLAFLVCAALATASGVARAQVAPSPSPTTRQLLTDAWWTGPMLAAGAGSLPRGHTLAEPYLYDVVTYGAFDRHGTLIGTPHANSFGSLTYLLYGLTDRLTVGAIPTFGYNTVSGGPSSSGVGVGDTSVIAQYRLTQFHVGSWVPTTSCVVEETLPTGKYDRLGDKPNDGFGGGAYTTMLSLYAQTYFWLGNGRILRARVDTTQTFSGFASVNGSSVYGTNAGFAGTVKPGNTFYVDVSQEYSVTRSWVLALDEVVKHEQSTRVSGGSVVLNSGASDIFELAPAVEYSWSANVGVLLGVRLTPAGRNAAATVTPAIAINIFH